MMSAPFNQLEPPAFNYSPHYTSSVAPATAPFNYYDKSPAYPVEMCMVTKKPKLVSFLYKFTDGMGILRCYLFAIGRYAARPTKGEFTVMCAGCQSAYVKMAKSGQQMIKLRSRKTDGLRLLSNAMANHIPGCHPKNYENVLRSYSLVMDVVRDKFIKREDIKMYLTAPATPFSELPLKQYPVAMVKKNTKRGHPMFIYRLGDKSSQCYRFTCLDLHRKRTDGLFLVRCSSCTAVYRQERKGGISTSCSYCLLLVDGHYIMSDPCMGHDPGCTPLNYYQVMKETVPVSEAEREEIIKKRAFGSSGIEEAADSALEVYPSKKLVSSNRLSDPCAQVCPSYDYSETMNNSSPLADSAREKIMERQGHHASPLTIGDMSDWFYPQSTDNNSSIGESVIVEPNDVQAQPPIDILKAAIDAAFLGDDQWIAFPINNNETESEAPVCPATGLYSTSGEPQTKRAKLSTIGC